MLMTYTTDIMLVFAIMMFGLTRDETLLAEERLGKNTSLFSLWLGPALLAALLLIILVFAINSTDIQQKLTLHTIDAKQVGVLLYGPYLLAVEIASFLLLAGLIAAYHFAKSDDISNQLPQHNRQGDVE